MACLLGRFSGLRHRRVHRAAIAAACVVALPPVLSATPADATTQVFAAAGAEQIFTVPAGVTTLHVVAIGGRGGAGADGGAAGGLGAVDTSDVPVTTGEVLYIEVGGNGGDGCCKKGVGPGPGG